MMRFHPFAAAEAMLAIVCLSGCTGALSLTPGGAPATASAPAAAPTQATLAQITATDLTTAIAEAQNATPPDTEAVACFGYLQSQLAVLNGQVNGLVAPTGIVSTFEAAHLGVDLVNGGILSPAQKQGFETNCGPYFMAVAGGLNQLLAKFGGAALSGGIAIP